MVFHSHIVAAEFHTRADAIERMKQVVAEVTAPSLDEEGCQIYHWSQGADDPTFFLLYMEWRDNACFEAHIATPHVRHAEDRLKREKCSSSRRKKGTSIEFRVNVTASIVA
jgi:quinol monooxygenase YgiN